MEQENIEKIDAIEVYYERCKKTAGLVLRMAIISTIVGSLVIIGLIVVLFIWDLSLWQGGLIFLLAMIMLGLAIFLYVFHMRRQREYVKYMEEKQAFSSCEKIVGEIEKSEDRDQMRIYIIKGRMSRFR